jgi:hypothetical protein
MKTFKLWLEEKRLELIQGSGGDDWYQMDIKNDSFVHFTSKERIPEILKSNMLMFRPPYEKFGTDAVNAVSLTYGEVLSGVQTTHIKGEVGAIWFKTNTIPYRGHVEEVIWNENVPFTQVKEITKEKAVSMINASPEKIDEMANVIYQSYEDFGKMHKSLVKSWG